MIEQVNYSHPSSRKSLDIKEFSKEKGQNLGAKNDDFYTICRKAKEYVYEVYDKKVEEKAKGQTKEDYVNIYHNAMKGIPSAVNLIKKHIEEFVIENGYRNESFPTYYKTLIDGIFEEEFGWGPLSAFKVESNCEGAQVLGTDIKFKRSWGWELQSFKFRSIKKVMELANRFSNMHSKTTLNEHTNPEIETRTHDNIRVSIMIPDRMHEEPVITLRRKVIKGEINFKALAEYGTLPYEAIPLFEALSKFSVNSVIAGPPGCGKSTMLQAFLNHCLYEVRNGEKIPERINTVYAETSPEWDVRSIHPNSNVLHVIGRGEDFEKIITSSILRHDITRVVLGEIREHEVGLYRRASLQGIKQVMGTLHDLDPYDIPQILSSLYMQYYSNQMDYSSISRVFAKNVHFAISMDEFLKEEQDAETLVKRVTGIHVYDVDNETNETRMYTIMEYDAFNEKWIYSNELPERFERLISKYDRRNYTLFKDTLEKLCREQNGILVGD